MTPRLWTPPLRDLSEPGASFGPLVERFACDVLAAPLDPWEAWLLLHAGELLPDGRPRFRRVLVLVARQNGKTHILVTLSLWWAVVERVGLVLGTSTKLDYAKESWLKAVELAERAPGLRGIVPTKRRAWLRFTNGENEWNLAGSRYKIATANQDGGRSLSIDALILDELRQHHTYAAWDATVPATSARPFAQVYALSNAGDDNSVVLNTERAAALAHLETGRGDPRVGIFEWSAPAELELADDDQLLAGILAANPNAGRRKDVPDLVNEGHTAIELGGDKLAGYKTEHLCIRVPKLDPAIDAGRWGACGPRDGAATGLAGLRDRVALCVDVSPDGLHATAAAAALRADGVAVVDLVKAWDGPAAAVAMAGELPALVERTRARAVAWFPSGGAAAAAGSLADRNRKGQARRPWPPRGVRVEEIRAEASAVCMAMASDVATLRVAHQGDPLLNDHAVGAEKAWQGAVWTFARSRDGGHVDALYAAAGAVWTARTMPPGLGVPRVVTTLD